MQLGQFGHWVGQSGQDVVLVIRFVAVACTKRWKDIQMNYSFSIYIKIFFENAWLEVIFKHLPGGLVSIGVDTSVPNVAAVGSVFNGVIASNVVSSTAKISNFICQYYNRWLISLHLMVNH